MAKKTVAKKSAKKNKAVKKTASSKPKSKKTTGKATDRNILQSQLEKLLQQKNGEKKLLDFCLALTEKERTRLSTFAAKWLRAQIRVGMIETEGRYQSNPLIYPAALAVLCCGPFSEIKKIGYGRMPQDEVTLEILKARKPKWTDEFVDSLLESDSYWFTWHLIREMVRSKMCRKPENPRYYTAMIQGLCCYSADGQRPSNAYEALSQDPKLLKHEVWKLFEHEGDGQNTLANTVEYSNTEWAQALLKFSQAGKLPRAKLVKASLQALQLGFNHYRSKWFLDFVDLLKPTDAELKKHSDTILGLTNSPIPNIARWAFEKVQVFFEKGIVKKPEKLVTALQPLTAAKKKKSVVDALKLLSKIVDQSPKLAASACEISAVGLSHEKADVQKLALKFLNHAGNPKDKSLRTAVVKYQPFVAASVQKPLQKWLDADPGSPEKPKHAATKKTRANKNNKNASQLKKSDFSKFDQHQREVLRIDKLFELLNDKNAFEIPACNFRGDEYPRLLEENRIEPIKDLEELFETAGYVFENDEAIEEGERVLAAIARLSTKRTENHHSLFAPTLKRAKQLIDRDERPFVGHSLKADICGLFHVWESGRRLSSKIGKSKHDSEQITISGMFDEPWETYYLPNSPIAFLSIRSFELAQRIGSGAVALLSEPTHRGGWICPSELVKRVNQLKEAPGEFDVMLSILRLAPHGKDAALKKLKSKLTGEWLDAITHALGGAAKKIGKNEKLWACAARARIPFADDPKVIKAFPKLGSGAGMAPDFKVVQQIRSSSYGPDRLIQTISPATRSKSKVAVPTEAIQSESDFSSAHDLGLGNSSIQWFSWMWPLGTETMFASAAQLLTNNRDWWEACWPTRCFMEPLVDPDIPLRRMGLLTLFSGLACKEPGEYGLATDVAIQAVADGRLGTDNIGFVLGEYFPSELYNLTRVANRLADVASVSDLHAFVIGGGLQNALPNFPTSRRGLGDLLNLLYEIGCQLGCDVDDTCRKYFGSFKGSGKAAKAAKLLLSLESGACDPATFVEESLVTRLERLNDWSTRKP